MRLYHGTWKKSVKSIKKKGIAPSSRIGKASSGIGKSDVDLVNNKKFASKYGDTIITVDIPKSKVRCNQSIDNPKLLFCTAKKVNKKYIGGIE